MKNLLLLVITLCSLLQLRASHIVGGEIFYDCLGGTSYKVTLKIYRDCSSTSPYDNVLPMTVFNGLGNQIYDFTIDIPPVVQLPVTYNNPCVSIPTGICIEEAIYTKVVNLPVSATGYTLSYQKCCRTNSTQNLNSPGEQGITLTIDIPPASDAICNNSPRFNNYPPLLLCTDEPLIFDHSATDPDGDSLVYELCTPYQGGGITLFPPNCGTCPSPIPALPPPYDGVVWAGGFSHLNPFGGAPANIDSETGLFTATPTVPGFFAVGVCVKEYRDGILLSTNVRDFIFQVMNCNFLLKAEITPQEEMADFVSHCQGLTITFDNASINGSAYVWDFGVTGITTDVSNAFEPTYTFPGPGIYDVMLIVNPSGAPCTDTSIQTFIVYEDIEISYVAPAPQCITDNSFNFNGEGIWPTTGTTFEWDFGADAFPVSSNSEDVNNVVFSNYGYHTAAFKVNYETCEEIFVDSVFVYAEPSVGFIISDELKCAPYTAVFEDTSYASTELFYVWNFGDGTELSNLSDPVHIYSNPGVYDVSLTIWTTEGCIDTLTVSFPSLIQIFPSPTAALSVSPTEATVFHPNFFFTNLSENEVNHTFYFTDGNSSSDNEIWHSYVESGYHYPYVVSINEYGCKDTAFAQIYIIPFTSVYVPNAFTPNGDGLNDIWQPVVYDTEQYEIWIFDRWGQLILNSSDETASWDGTQNGKHAPVGVYNYYIKYISTLDGLPYEVHGHFNLVK